MPGYIEISRMVEDYIHEKKITGKLPGIIALSKKLDVNRITLAKAFHLLEERGIITICGTGGSFVNLKRRRMPRYHSLAVVGLNVDAPEAQERCMVRMNDIAGKQNFNVLNLGLSFLQLKDNRDIFGNFPVDGYLFHNSRLTIEHVDFFNRTGIPFVNMGKLNGAELRDLIDHDHRSGYPIALRHLMELGHRRIAYIEYAVREEIRDYTDTVHHAFASTLGAFFDPELFYVRKTCRELENEYGSFVHRVYMHEALKHLFSRPEPPTAVITVSALMIPCYEMLRGAGLEVPGDVSLIGVEGNAPNKTVTTLFYDTDELLMHGTARLLDVVNGNDSEPYEFLQKPLLVSPELTTGIRKKSIKAKDTRRIF